MPDKRRGYAGPATSCDESEARTRSVQSLGPLRVSMGALGGLEPAPSRSRPCNYPVISEVRGERPVGALAVLSRETCVEAELWPGLTGSQTAIPPRWPRSSLVMRFRTIQLPVSAIVRTAPGDRGRNDACRMT